MASDLFYEYNQPYERRENRILFVGSLEPRKNLTGLLAAFNLYRSRCRSDSPLRLTVVGCENPLFADQDYDLGEYGRDIEFVGYISDTDLARLYGNSKMLVYPSFYEGFGFPPLEAMAAGTPVITSRRSSLPEVAGDAALLVDPSDPEDIAAKIEIVARGGDVVPELIARGLRQVSRFNWERVGSHVLQLYEELLEPRGVAGLVPMKRQLV